jgi:hypothetical protein
MTNDDEFWFVLIFGSLFFGLVFISAVGQAYLYLFKRQKILNHLNNSRSVLRRKSFLSGGLLGVFFEFAFLGSCLVLPSWAIKGGSLDENDYLNFPLGLLRAIRFCYLSALGGGVALIVFLIGCKYMGWI